MPYPKDPPTSKHDLVGPKLESDSSSRNRNRDLWVLDNSKNEFASTTELFHELEQPQPPSNSCGGTVKLSSVYTYRDGPQQPGPLSRTLRLIGFADTSLSLVRILHADNDNDDATDIPSCFHKCTIGVKRADSQYSSRLDPSNVTNSNQFAKLVRSLRNEGVVGILGCDKYGRFGILQPMKHSNEDDARTNSQESCAEDYAATFFVGNVKKVKEYLFQRLAAAASSSDEPVYAPLSPDGSNERADLWQPPGVDNDAAAVHSGEQQDSNGGGNLWQPPGLGADDPSSSGGFFDSGTHHPDRSDGGGGGGGGGTSSPTGFDPSWQPPSSSGEVGDKKRKRSDSDNDDNINDEFHADSGAAAADAFYSGLTRSLDTRADSRLYHMRAFNGWVKATQISELDPKTTTTKSKTQTSARGGGQQPLRVLDLACGKGGDLGKWVLHNRGIGNYVGIDVARGSLSDAALRARKMRRKLKGRCTFTCSDLGSDVPGRLRSSKHKHMQKLLTWSLQGESEYEASHPIFRNERGGGISAEDKFDVVSIQFAIHYMMSTRKRARRFFHTVSQLLEIGGNLVATTIDARVILQHIMGLGNDLFSLGGGGGGENSSSGSSCVVPKGETEKIVVSAGGVCRIEFNRDMVRRIFTPSSASKDKNSDSSSSKNNSESSMLSDDLFGLQYTFILAEGSDHASGVGDAVNLPEWLTPIPVLRELALEVGLELEVAQNFHEFFKERRDPVAYPNAHNALYNMKVLDRNGSISPDEWEISRLYAALKFRKVRESELVLDEESDEEESCDEEEKDKSGSAPNVVNNNAARSKLLPVAIMKAKRAVGSDQWQSLGGEEKKKLIEIELDKLA